ncbi:MAG: IS701 family transposase [Pirellulales bacterium]|nr:IS701 family transposase [Pirellulales bacterium]MBX3434820.1 IS701 family transposase [Pirellulales bacterium]MBX3435132.1 IS701 family transposase [Pirellulales bacterium]MBX3649658.1 IS701 family transposase [Rhodocyclaceae bacterium]
MPAIVEFPRIVRDVVERCADLFSNEPQRRHFAEYLTGLIVAKRKSVSGINAEFIDATDQSCLNRFVTAADWDVEGLNAARLALLQEDEATRFGDRGVIALDDVLVDHDGKLIEDVGWFWDHAEQRHKIAHDWLFANYVCPSGKHYPLEFRRFKKRAQCEATGEAFEDHGKLFRQLVDWVCERNIPGDFAFDSYFSGAANLNCIHEHKNSQGEARAYVGDLKTNRNLEVRGRSIRVDEFAATISREDRRELRRGDDRQWFYTTTVRIPQVKHPVRIVLIWKNRRDKRLAKVLIANRTRWEVKRILQTYRSRWTGTETFHRDGKQELGMGACQLRSGQGQTRHMHLVMTAYTVLMRQLNARRAKEWVQQRLTTIGQACRAVADETLAATLRWAIREITEKARTPQHVFNRLGLI